ncbi:unnamed protein product [Gadus morhua 'NCC']
MMDKKSANGFSSKAGEGVPRKQLPYSVETPYGFHLDLDFLKYVDDIEKGNTIKRVHIHRRIKGPKFSTLPRNFSLPGHGVRPAPKDKDTWTATSTLGPKPKSRVTEVQQIFDFRPSDGGSMHGSGYVTNKPRDEVNVGTRGLDERPLGLQSRPNLLRASSMPITVQHRKGSDSSSPDRVVVTPENGSSENVFRASPDFAERRSLPQDRTGLHQQITVALKRVRELEEQVKTIPELKAQICSLREERERLVLELQAQARAQARAQAQAQDSSISTTNPRADTETRLEDDRSSKGLAVIDQPKASVEASSRTPVEVSEGLSKSTGSQIDRKSQSGNLEQGEAGDVQRCKTQPSEKSEQVSVEPTRNKSLQDLTSQRLPSPQRAIKDAEDGVPGGQLPKQEELKGQPISSDAELTSLQQLQHKLTMLDAKLSQASQELERTQGLLKEQIEDNKQKDVRILQLSEGVRVEVCTTQPRSTARRVSVDRATVMERVGFANQETETECPGTVDQGTDTDRICIEVCIPRILVGSLHQQAEIEIVDNEAETLPPARQRANSVDRGTETERIGTQDQTTETPTADRVNQVTETVEGPSINHPMRPRASSVDRGTLTERVGTVDRVTETVAAPRTDQQTETETQRDRRQNGNPVRNMEVQAIVLRDVVVIESEESGNEGITAQESVATDNFISESVSAVTESIASVIPDDETKDGQTCDSTATEVNKDTKLSLTLHTDLETREVTSSMVKAVREDEDKDALKTLEQMETATDKLIIGVTTMVTECTSVVVIDDSSVSTVIPLRPQRGRTPTTEQSSLLQLQAPPVRPQRGSSEILPQQATPQPIPLPAKSQVEEKALVPVQTKASPQPVIATSSENQNLSKTSSEQQSSPQIQAQPPAEVQPQPRKPSLASNDRQPQPKLRAQKKPPSPGSSDTPNPPQSQTSVSRRDSKEPQPSRRRSTETSQTQSQTYPARRGLSEAQQGQPSGPRRGSGEKEPFRRSSGETPTVRRGSSEAAQRRGSTEAQALRRETGDAQSSRRGSGESPTSPAALGQVVTRLTGLLGEQWAQLGSGGSGAQPAAPSQQEGQSTQKLSTGKRAVPAKGVPAKPAGKAASAPAVAVAVGKPIGKAGPSKMSSIQSQLVSSLSVLSAFYSPAQKAAAAKKQQEQGLKSIMKKNGATAKRSSGGAKKNLKFVGVNGGYESTSSEESSADEKTMRKKKESEEVGEEKEEEKQSSAVPDAQQEDKLTPTAEQEVDVAKQEGAQAQAVGEGAMAALEVGLLEFQEEEQVAGGQVEQGFVDACIYVKDRMGEVSSPDKEMRQVLLVLYQEWFRVSSQRSSEADMVRLYLRQVSRTTPTLLPYVVNLTDGNGNTALHYSVSHSNFPVVRLLLDTGLCETDNVNKAGYTAVMLAALTATDRHDDLEVVLQLLRQGQVDARSSQAGQTALMLAVSHGRVAMVKLLLSCGADVNSQDRDGSTALMCACEHGHVHIARLLLETGRCDSSLVDKDGQTAMTVATAAPHQDVVDLLKSHAETGIFNSTSSSSYSSISAPARPLS